jgi:hypothetical protein
MTERRIKFLGVGPLTRSTVGKGVPDPQEEAFDDVLHWIWSWRLQAHRLIESLQTEGRGSTRIDQRRSFSATTYDLHMLAVAGRHLATAIANVREYIPEIHIAEKYSAALRLLRHLHEHWDQQRQSFQAETQKKLSGKGFVERFPGDNPWSLTDTGEDLLLGGVLPIRAFTRDLKPIEEMALATEAKRSRDGLPGPPPNVGDSEST